jgi:hypothetical protein
MASRVPVAVTVLVIEPFCTGAVSYVNDWFFLQPWITIAAMARMPRSATGVNNLLIFIALFFILFLF